MKCRLTLLIVSLISISGVFAQKEFTQLYTTTRTLEVISPIKLDSTNLKGEKFTDKDLLKMKVAIPPQSDFSKELVPSRSGYFQIETLNENPTFHLFSFYVSANRYGKAALKITSPNLLEVYVDGKLVESKTTQEDSLKLAKELSTGIAPYPNTNRVVIKLLKSASSKLPASLKVSINNEKKDSKTEFDVAYTDKRSFSFLDVLTGNRVTNARISPNGQYVLLTYTNSFDGKTTTSVELYTIKTGKRVLIDPNNSKTQLNWMPRSEKLFYTSKTNNIKNLITINPETLEESVLVRDVPDESVKISPDEKLLFYSKTEKPDENKSDLKRIKAPYDRQPNYDNRSFICVYNIATGLSQQLTFGSHSTSLQDISFDSKQILFSVSDEDLTKRPFNYETMYLLNLETRKLEKLWEKDGFTSGASFSPDANKILVSGSPEAFGGIGLNIAEGQIANSYDRQLFIMNLATKEIEPITKDFDPSVDQSFWNTKDNMIYMKVTDKDFVRIYSYNPSNKKYTLLPADEDVVRALSVANSASVAAYTGVSIANSTRAYIYDLKGNKSTLIANPYKEQASAINYGEYKDWNFTNSAGTVITGRAYFPPYSTSSKKYPLIVYYYGGTTPTSRSYEHNYPPHVYAALGYVVYVVQPSGAIGFGQKFSALHVNAWGKRTAEDIIEGTKQFVKEHPIVDEKKIGCIGASYGGFMTMYLQTQTDMFAAAVSHAGISSISSYWGEGYWGYAYSSGASAHSYPWNNQEMYVNQSPLFNADKIKTPLLLMHGTDDTNVPVGESIQMFTALKILGKPVELIQVKGENHIISNYKRRIEWMNSIMAWFDKWLKDDDGWWKAQYPDSKS